MAAFFFSFIHQVGKASGKLRNFIIEPFVPHEQDQEAYVCIYSHRAADVILFTTEGGVDIGDVDAKADKMEVPVDGKTRIEDDGKLDVEKIKGQLLGSLKGNSAKQDRVARFIAALYKFYVDLYFTYLEINPLVVTDESIYILDLAAKLDATADFVCRGKWGKIEYPPPFGRDAFPEEAYIADIDAKTGASLKVNNKLFEVCAIEEKTFTASSRHHVSSPSKSDENEALFLFSRAFQEFQAFLQRNEKG